MCNETYILSNSPYRNDIVRTNANQQVVIVKYFSARVYMDKETCAKQYQSTAFAVHLHEKNE